MAAVGKDSAAVHTRIHHPLTIKRYAEGRGAAMILIKLSVFLARQSGILALRTQLVLILGRNIWNHYIDWVENFEAIERRRSSFGLDFVRCRQLRNLGLTQDIFLHLTEFFLCYLSLRISLFQYF